MIYYEKSYKAIDRENLKSVVSVFEEVISDNAKILFDKSKPYLVVQKEVDLAVDEADEIFSFSKDCEDIVEMSIEEDKWKSLVNIFDEVALKGAFISFVVVQSKKDFMASFELKAPSLLGSKIYEQPELAQKTAIFCVTKYRIAEPIDIKLVIKVSY
jgi:hypothetical protein